jgi:hypothetical protein
MRSLGVVAASTTRCAEAGNDRHAAMKLAGAVAKLLWPRAQYPRVCHR